jgi:DNA polymerase elongation subunit (family B)
MTTAYGLDIETDTACGGLDPGRARILAVAVAGAEAGARVRAIDGLVRSAEAPRPARRWWRGGLPRRDGDRDVTVLTGTEPLLLRRLDALLAGLDPGVIVTWNGSGFDLPFLADRARRCGVELGLDLWVDPALPGQHEPLPGHAGRYRGRWHGHRHADAYLVYRALEQELGRSCSLKAVARRAGLRVVEADASRVHELGPGRLRRYVGSDARLTLELARARWDDTVAWIDPEGPAPISAVAG